MAGMRVRVAIGLAVLATLGGLLVDMSRSAPRGAGDDHIARAGFYNVVPGGGTLCQGAMALPGDAASINVLIGTAVASRHVYPIPRIAVDFKNARGRPVATGLLRAGTSASQAGNAIPLRYPHGPSVAGTLCLHVGGKHPIALAGFALPAVDAEVTVNGQPQTGRVAVNYMRPGSESWWQLLGALDLRFGLGKSSIFGDWTLPVLALVALALWVVAIRFLVRELT